MESSAVCLASSACISSKSAVGTGVYVPDTKEETAYSSWLARSVSEMADTV